MQHRGHETRRSSFFVRSWRVTRVVREMGLRRCVSRGLSMEKHTAMTLELIRIGRAFRIYLFDRMFQEVIVGSVAGDA